MFRYWSQIWFKLNITNSSHFLNTLWEHFMVQAETSFDDNKDCGS